MKIIRIIPVLFLLLGDACIERYEVPTIMIVPRLVVDGLITNQPGPYVVRLTKSVDINSSLNSPVPVIRATVRILDDAGTSETLIESAPGVYQTRISGIRGVIGRKYHLRISIGEKEYITDPQELKEPGTIENITRTFEANSINKSEPSKPQDAFSIHIDAKGVDGIENLFRWRWIGMYEVVTYPQLRTFLFGRPPQEYANPLECSGYIPAGGLNITQVGECTCCNCWATEVSENALISNNQFVNNNQFSNVFITRIPVGEHRFDVKYFIKVQQLSVSEEVYTFWKLVKAQQDGEGSLFQPNSIKVRGNVKSLSHPGEEVLGVFGVSGIVEKEIFIKRDEVPVVVTMDEVRGSCLGFARGSVNVKPAFW